MSAVGLPKAPREEFSLSEHFGGLFRKKTDQNIHIAFNPIAVEGGGRSAGRRDFETVKGLINEFEAPSLRSSLGMPQSDVAQWLKISENRDSVKLAYKAFLNKETTENMSHGVKHGSSKEQLTEEYRLHDQAAQSYFDSHIDRLGE